MKKLLLLAAAALAFSANAQKVQNIPTTAPLQLTDGYCTIEENNIPPAEAGEIVYIGTHDKYDGGATYAIQNMRPTDKAVFKLNNTADNSCFIVKFLQACKPEWKGAQGVFTLTNGEGDEVWSYTYNPPANGKASYDYRDAEIYIEEPIEAGEYTFSIEFLNENGNAFELNTFNISKISFEARDVVLTSSVYTIVDPDETAGTITLTPGQEKYLNGTDIAVLATPATGWKFQKFEFTTEVNDETVTEEKTTNSFTFNIQGSTDIVAYFEEVIMYNTLPCWINWYTRLIEGGKIQTSNKQVTLDGENHGEIGEPEYLGDYRHGKSEAFEVRVPEDGTFDFEAAYSYKRSTGAEQATVEFKLFDKAQYDELSTNATPEWTYTLKGDENLPKLQWNNFFTVKEAGVQLTAGNKILHLTFSEPVAKKYTINLLRVGFGKDGDFGMGGVDNVAVEKNVVRRAFNLQGVEVAPDTKGLIIFSDGQKVLNK